MQSRRVRCGWGRIPLTPGNTQVPPTYGTSQPAKCYLMETIGWPLKRLPPQVPSAFPKEKGAAGAFPVLSRWTRPLLSDRLCPRHPQPGTTQVGTEGLAATGHHPTQLVSPLIAVLPLFPPPPKGGGGRQSAAQRGGLLRAWHSPFSPTPGGIGARGEPSPYSCRALYCNDPSAGSPTDTLLRLLLPLDRKVRSGYPPAVARRQNGVLGVPISHPATQSVGATGGVYKEQGQNRHGLVNRAY